MFLSSKRQLIDTLLRAILDISNTTAQSRAILTTMKAAAGHPEEVVVDRRWCVIVKRFQLFTTEMAMGLITTGVLWCPHYEGSIYLSRDSRQFIPSTVTQAGQIQKSSKETVIFSRGKSKLALYSSHITVFLLTTYLEVILMYTPDTLWFFFFPILFGFRKGVGSLFFGCWGFFFPFKYHDTM